jgi:hypothetical protein
MTTRQRAIDLPRSASALQGRIETTAISIVGALRGLFREFDEPVTTAADLTRATGLNRNSASKVMIALGQREPLASMYAMPGPEALRKLARGARKRGIAAEDLKALERALDAYEDLLTRELDGKPALDGAIALWLPDARGRVEASSRHLVYRGMAALRGISLDTSFELSMIAPSASVPDRCDVLVCAGTLGLRRLVPSAPVRLLATKHENPAVRFERIDGRPMVHRPMDGMLAAYSSNPLPMMREVSYDTKTVWAVTEDGMGVSDSLDLVFAEFGVGLAFRTPPSGRRMGHSHIVAQPTREVVVDSFIHRDVWPQLRPECVVYDTVSYGAANFNDHSRDIDRIPLASSLRELGEGIDSIASASIPRYRELAAELCERKGWNPRDFRGYRFSSSYPVYGGQYSLIYTAT